MKEKKSSKVKQTSSKSEQEEEEGNKQAWNPFANFFMIFIGLAVAVYMGYRHALYCKILHENDMWFSNIKVGIINLFQSIQ